MKKKALITGITGQDGAYLAAHLLEQGYEVHGIQRRASTNNTERLTPLLEQKKISLHYGDMTDSSNLIRLMKLIEPDEVYHLAAQSHVAVSFETPEYTANADALGTLRLLEAIRILGLEQKTKFYQASSSELFGKVQTIPQTETTPFYPRSPYAAAKLYAYWITINYREAYNIFACNGILFNHESPLRGETFVTRKITQGVAAIHHGHPEPIALGNLDAERDWGHAKDFVRAMHLMLQQKTPDDYVVATGKTRSVRDFVERAFQAIDVRLRWEGKGRDERGIREDTGAVVVIVDPKYFRPTEVDLLLGDASKAKEQLGWFPHISFDTLVEDMVKEDIRGIAEGIRLHV